MRRTGWSHRRTEIAVALIGGAALVIAALVTGLFGLVDSGAPTDRTQVASVHSSGSANSGSCVGGSVVNGGTIICGQTTKRPAVVRSPILTTADAGCGTPRERRGLSIRLRVVMWCAPLAVRGQYEFKLKVSVKNTGRKPLDIDPSHFFLLWKALDPHQWSAPPGGGPAPPRRVRYEGQTYWAISANPNGVAEAITSIDWTFATHWTHHTLGPGATSMQLGPGSSKLQLLEPNGAVKTIRFNVNQDDLVFYVPKSAVARPRNFLGLAYWDGHEILAVCPQSHWGPKIPPGYWTGH